LAVTAGWSALVLETNEDKSCPSIDAESTRMTEPLASILKASQPLLGILNLGMV
jgi:hypothetical protein